MSALAGRRVLVTRARHQAEELAEKLRAEGGEPILFPVIAIAPLDDYTRLDQAIASLRNYDWVAFTSVNGVRAFWERLELAGTTEVVTTAEALGSTSVAAIGPATARALEGNGVRAAYVPSEHISDRIPDGLGDVDGRRILLPRAEGAREALAHELRRRGALVDELPVYRTLPVRPGPEAWEEFHRGVDAITFASASTVRAFAELIGHQLPSTPSVDTRPVVACIGPITAQAAHDAGFPVDVMAREYTLDGLVAALAEHFS